MKAKIYEMSLNWIKRFRINFQSLRELETIPLPFITFFKHCYLRKTFAFESFSPVNTIKIFYPRNFIHFVYLSIRMMGLNENNLTPNVLFISLIASNLLLIDWSNTFMMSDYFLLHELLQLMGTWIHVRRRQSTLGFFKHSSAEFQENSNSSDFP